MTDDPMVRLDLIMGTVELRPAAWIHRADGSFGQEWLRIERDYHGKEISRETLPPVGWLSWS